MDEDSKRRLHGNPLRILVSKNPDMQRIVRRCAPCCSTRWTASRRPITSRYAQHLKNAGIEYHVEPPSLVRGLDYYTRTVFEWTTDALGSQSTVCGGGRYDGLVEQLGGASVPGIGWAMGLERIVMLLEKHGPGRYPCAAAGLYGTGRRKYRDPGLQNRGTACGMRGRI